MKTGEMSALGDPNGIDGSGILLPGNAVRVERDSIRLIGGRCRSCSLETFPRYGVCPGCMEEDVIESQMPSEGIVYSVATVHVGPARWHKPLTLGYVDLTNGVRVFGHLKKGCGIGQRVTVGLAEVGRDNGGAPINSFIFQPAER